MPILILHQKLTPLWAVNSNMLWMPWQNLDLEEFLAYPSKIPVPKRSSAVIISLHDQIFFLVNISQGCVLIT